MKYLNKTIQEIHELLKEKKIKPIDLVEEAFENIENNQELNAYITLNKEEAIKQAKALETKEVDTVIIDITHDENMIHLILQLIKDDEISDQFDYHFSLK